MEENVYNSTTKGKVKFYSFIILLLSFLLFIESDWFSALIDTDTSEFTIEQSKSRLIKSAKKLVYLNSSLLIVHFGFALLIYRFGRRIHKTKQYPPPGVDIPFSMKIKKGKKAIQQAYGTYIVSVLIVSRGISELVFSILFLSKMTTFFNAI